MTFEVKMHGVTITAHEDGQVALHVGGASVQMAAADFASIVRVLEAVASLVSVPSWVGAANASAPASVRLVPQTDAVFPIQAAVGALGGEAAASVSVQGPGRPRSAGAAAPVAVADLPVKRGPGRPRKHPLTTAPAGQAPAVQATDPLAASAHRGPGRPRKVPQGAAVAVATAPVERRGPGRPRKVPQGAAVAGSSTEPQVKRGPGRPRKSSATATLSADAPAKRGPGRPRKAAAPAGGETGTAPASEAAPAAAAGQAPASAAPRKDRGNANQLRDQIDRYMRDNPGPKTMDELVRAATDGAWAIPEGTDARRTLDITVPRHRDMFIRQIDGTFIRRAEIEALSAVPGKMVRRRGEQTVVISKPATGPEATA